MQPEGDIKPLRTNGNDGVQTLPDFAATSAHPGAVIKS